MKVVEFAILGALFIPAAAVAGNVMIPAKVAIVKPLALAKFVAKNTAPFPLPSGPSEDPTLNGAEIRFFDIASGGGSFTHALPASGWVALGNPPGSKGYKYRGKKATPIDTTCSVVLIKPAVIKGVCKGSAVTLSTPFTGDEAISLGIPNVSSSAALRYCAQPGGVTKKNDATLLKRINAAAPPYCAGDTGWVAYGIDDCSGGDTACSVGSSPDPLLCDGSTAGTSAICWDGVTHSNGEGCSSSTTWCTYKNTSTSECTGGGSPGYLFTCVPP